MRKKELEKLELDIAREKDPEIAERLKAVLEVRKSERRERKLRLQERWWALCRESGRLVRFLLIAFAIVLGGIITIGLLIAWVTGAFSR